MNRSIWDIRVGDLAQIICGVHVVISTYHVLSNAKKLWSLSRKITALEKTPNNDRDSVDRRQIPGMREQLEQCKWKLTVNLVKALFFGVCAMNLFPFAPFLGVFVSIISVKRVFTICRLARRVAPKIRDGARAAIKKIASGGPKVVKGIFKAAIFLSKGCLAVVAKVIRIALKIITTLLKGAIRLVAHPKIAMVALLGVTILVLKIVLL